MSTALTVDEQLLELLPGLAFGLGTHVDWAEWFEKHPDDPRIAALGDAAFHRAREDEYVQRMNVIKAAALEIKNLRMMSKDSPMTDITAKHRIITDDCRKRPIEDVIAETLQSMEAGIRQSLEGWPTGAGTEIHAKVVIVRAPKIEVYSRPECVFNYCASPEDCRASERCVSG